VRLSASLVEAPPRPVTPARPLPQARGARARLLPEFRDFRPTAVYDRYALAPGDAFDGPAIVEERESTLVIGPGGRFQVAASGSLIVTIG
jgi:N-methylhydantoinase A